MRCCDFLFLGSAISHNGRGTYAKAILTCEVTHIIRNTQAAGKRRSVSVSTHNDSFLMQNRFAFMLVCSLEHVFFLLLWFKFSAQHLRLFISFFFFFKHLNRHKAISVFRKIDPKQNASEVSGKGIDANYSGMLM